MRLALCAASVVPAVAVLSSSHAADALDGQAASNSAPSSVIVGSSVGAPLVLVRTSLEAIAIERFSVDGDDLLVWRAGATKQPATRTPLREGSATANTKVATPERIELSDCAAILRGRSGAQSSSAALWMADGQRFPGEIRRSTGAANGPGVAWRHRWFGELPVTIDLLRAVVLQSGTTVPVVEANDVVVLANGDRLEGVVTNLGTVVRLDRTGSGTASSTTDANGAGTTGEIDVPIDRVAAIAFITPVSEGTNPRIWCADGTVADATVAIDPETGLMLLRRLVPVEENGSDGSTQGTDGRGTATQASSQIASQASGQASGQVSGQAASQPARGESTPLIRAEEILGFAPRPDRVRALATLPVTSAVASGETPRFHVRQPTVAAGIWPVGTAPIAIHGPTRATFELPAQGCSIAAELHVYEPDPRWTNFEVIVRDGDREILRQSMNAASAPIPLSAQLTSRELSVEVSEGDRGPIRDAIEIRRALVLLPQR